MRKRTVSMLVILTTIINLFSALSASAQSDTTGIKLGDYVQMGMYQGQAMMWRCVSFEKIMGYDENGNPIVDATDTRDDYADGYLPLLLSDKVLCNKAFDANGEISTGSHGRGYKAGKYRVKYGSNYWGDSNIREWLNAETETVDWQCGNKPDSLGTTANPYDGEAGFLTGFTNNEKNAILQVNHKVILDGCEYSEEQHVDALVNDSDIETAVQNYDTAFSENATDKMMLLDVKQINTIYNNESILGYGYYIGKDSSGASVSTWISTPNAEDTGDVSRYISFYGTIENDNSYNGECGVRPAFYLNLLPECFKSGTGSKSDPYCVTYTYKFIDYDGSVVKSGLSDEESDIVVPEKNPDHFGKTFVQWDGYTKGMKQTAENLIFNAVYVEDTSKLKLGDYVQMGTYYGAPILWRCVSFEKVIGYDDDGNPIVDATDTRISYEDGYIPLMLSDKILCLKPFDANGENTSSHNRGRYEGMYRAESGSNYIGDSNIRDWLNADTVNVEWSCGNKPDSEHVWNGYNAYDSEAGFLTNFSKNEKKAIITVNHKVLLDRFEDSTTENPNYHKYNTSIKSVAQNYDTAFSENIIDKMMFLDVKQINTVYNNENILGEDYYIGRVTKECFENAQYKGNLTEGGKWSSWVGSPSSNNRNSNSVRYISNSGYVFDALSFNGSYGVRPAFYFDLSSTDFVSGNGSENEPYCLTHILVSDIANGIKILSANDISLSIVEAEYDNNGKLVRCIINNVAIKAGEPYSYIVDADKYENVNNTVKIMVLDSIESIKPLCDVRKIDIVRVQE